MSEITKPGLYLSRDEDYVLIQGFLSDDPSICFGLWLPDDMSWLPGYWKRATGEYIPVGGKWVVEFDGDPDHTCLDIAVEFEPDPELPTSQLTFSVGVDPRLSVRRALEELLDQELVPVVYQDLVSGQAVPEGAIRKAIKAIEESFT